MSHTFKRLILAVALEDGRTWDELVITNRAHVAWDLTRNRERWPESKEAAMLWMTHLAWSQLKADDDYAGKWEDFKGDCLHVETVPDPMDPETAKTDDVDPTTPAPAADSAST